MRWNNLVGSAYIFSMLRFQLYLPTRIPRYAEQGLWNCRASVCMSVCLIILLLRRVCCCGPCCQKISINCCTARRSAAKASSVTLSADVGSWTQTCSFVLNHLYKCTAVIVSWCSCPIECFLTVRRSVSAVYVWPCVCLCLSQVGILPTGNRGHRKRNGAWQTRCYYTPLIGSVVLRIYSCHFQWPWMTPKVTRLLQDLSDAIRRAFVRHFALFQLTRRVARSLGDSWASCICYFERRRPGDRLIVRDRGGMRSSWES